MHISQGVEQLFINIIMEEVHAVKKWYYVLWVLNKSIQKPVCRGKSSLLKTFLDQSVKFIHPVQFNKRMKKKTVFPILSQYFTVDT